MDGHVWLIGMMGSGKSSVARGLAARLGVPAIDLDEDVTRHAGCTIAELWGSRGEAAFRDLEAAAVDRVAARPPTVVATGGGVVLRRRNVERMRTSGVVVWLTAPVEELANRVGDGDGRPLLTEGVSEATLAEILDARRARYEEAAHWAVDTAEQSIADVVDRIATEIGTSWTGS